MPYTKDELKNVGFYNEFLDGLRSTYISDLAENALNEKPFKIELEQTRNVQGEIVKDKFTASQEGKDLRFRTKRQAKEWAETNWVSNEGIENQLKLVTDKVKNIEEPSKEWRKQQGRLKKSQRGKTNEDNH